MMLFQTRLSTQDPMRAADTFSESDVTLCPCLGALGRVGGAVSFSLHFVVSCRPLAAAAHYYSGG